MSHRIRLALAATLALAALAGAALPAAAQTPKPGGTLRAAMRAEVSTYDPHKGASGSDHMYLYPVFDTLVRFDEKMNARPGLAESWETPDPKTLVLKLRKGVKFHDGTPFNAEAVRFNIARGQDKATSSMSSELTSIDKVEVVDEHTVRLRLKAPDASLVLAFADRAGMMISPTAVQKLGDQFGRTPVGAGEYRMVRWQPGSEARLERFADYYEPGRPYLDAIVFKIIPDADTRVSALRSGQVDFIMEVPAQDFAGLKGERGLRAYEGPTLAYWRIFMNMAKPPLDKKGGARGHQPGAGPPLAPQDRHLRARRGGQPAVPRRLLGASIPTSSRGRTIRRAPRRSSPRRGCPTASPWTWCSSPRPSTCAARRSSRPSSAPSASRWTSSRWISPRACRRSFAARS